MSDATLTFGSLFSGIGGFDLGFEQAEMQCLWQVENDAKASSVLARHWPDVQRFEDVKNVGRDNLRPVDVICGGFPCQDVSVAGNRAGLAGERSGLWFEFHRILDELRPRWVVIENVPGLLSSNDGRDFATILRGLVELRYGVTWRVLDSQYFGVAQRRRRVFLVGHLGGGRSAEVLFERTSVSGRPPAREEKRQGTTRNITPSIVSNGDAGSGFRDEKGLVLHQDTGYTVSGYGEYREGTGTLRVSGGDVASTVSARDYKGDTDLVVFQQNQRDEVRDLGDVAGALQAQPGMKQQNYLAYSVKTAQTGSNGWGVGEEVMGTLDGANGFAVAQPLRSNVYNNSDPGLDAAMQIYSASGVRRLTPTECCRLQGFPDDWNAYGVERRAMYSEPSNLGDEAEIIEWETVPQSDSARYKQLGNAVTVSVAKWIGQQIMRLRKEEDSE